jgi:hypothetical protein
MFFQQKNMLPKNTNSDDEVFLKAKHLTAEDDSIIALLRLTGLQRVVSRAVYAEEYQQSLAACFPRGKGFEVMLAAHIQHLQATKQNKQLDEFVTRLRNYKPKS